MSYSYYSTLVLTILLAIGLAFFLRAASKDRTTVVDIASPLPPLDVLNGMSSWLEERGWKGEGGDLQRQIVRFHGSVSSSPLLAIFLSILCSFGAGCLGLVICQLYPVTSWWPLTLAALGPCAGLFYKTRSTRIESFEIRLVSAVSDTGTLLRVRAHRDELIAIDLELSKKLKLISDKSLTASPI
ncbi:MULTISPECIES: cofactor assembly of complex C subunit B [unclassified Prochlorococcus]|uniref:cofactor assembly of complex C subunit B n=1 Tax=unclassified Prochlorococcus TaxID=2627481 RepID=UPI00053399D2|nr:MULTISPECIES: cofactor assembly of complex C subunit B [unclassified Prochlorococcus]KGG14650.1 hypothetical protein EV06_1710 [Prochlorococcus sp. MIT 0602]KGG15920.1 hypothetical protein EV07_1887 [Prochlorococcus sp. MIT 0603]